MAARRPGRARSSKCGSTMGVSTTSFGGTTPVTRRSSSRARPRTSCAPTAMRCQETAVKHAIDLAEQIPGTYWHAAAILKLELDPVVRVPAQELRLEIGGGAVTRRVHAAVGPVIGGPGSLSVPQHWTAAEHPNLFPVMDGELRIIDVAGNRIELRHLGEYHTPLGAVGAIANAMAGRRV